MKPTAQDILNHCEAVVNGEIPQPLPFWVEADYDGLARPQYIFYYAKPQDDVESHVALIFWGFAAQIPPHTLQLAARLLGMDSEPAPAEIVLKWDGNRATYNEYITAETYSSIHQKGWHPRIYVGGHRVDEDIWNDSQAEAQQWCADTIKAITTQTPKQ